MDVFPKKILYLIALWALLAIDFVFPLDTATHAAVHLAVGIAGSVLILAKSE